MGRSWLSENIIPVAGSAAVLCGLLFLGLTGAPPRLLLINLVALGAGIALLAIARLLPGPGPALRSGLLLAAAAALLATALLGVTAQGATRWIVLGGLSIQPSLVLLPALLLAHVTKPDRVSAIAVALAALAMALQPDRSLAAAIPAAMLVAAACRRTPAGWLAAAAPVAALAATLLLPDNLPAVAYVDQILWTSPADQPLAALAVWAGTLILFVPGAALWRAGWRAEAAGFAVFWACLVVSAMLHNYPTPLVGYGASSILGYLLIGLAPPFRRRHARPQAGARPQPARDPGTGDAWRVAPSTL